MWNSLFSVAQNNSPTNLELSVFADSCFNELVEGVLLVRLKSNTRKISKMNSYGYTQQATNLQFKQDKENREIINSFKDHYTFSKAYFFFSEYSNDVRAKDFSSAFFLDANLQIDTSIVLATSKFLTAEFGNIQRDQSGLGMYFGALRMMNAQFEQLRRPFPRYVRTFDSLPLFKRSTGKTVIKLNQKLHNYLIKD